MVITYNTILDFLVVNGQFKKQFLLLDEPIVFKGIVKMQRDLQIESYININITKKLAYILKTYYSGAITKDNPCIEKVVDNQIFFRSCRVFPTLYLDLLVIANRFKDIPVELHFKKLFLGYHIIGVNSFYKGNSSSNYNKCLQHWNTRFAKKGKKLLAMTKYYNFVSNER